MNINHSMQLVPLAKCSVSEVKSGDSPEVHYRGMRVTFGSGETMDTIILLTNSVNEKAQWLADFSQCVENEKQNKILQFQRYLDAPTLYTLTLPSAP